MKVNVTYTFVRALSHFLSLSLSHTASRLSGKNRISSNPSLGDRQCCHTLYNLYIGCFIYTRNSHSLYSFFGSLSLSCYSLAHRAQTSSPFIREAHADCKVL